MFELGEAVVPSTIDEGGVDDQLGEHLEDADVQFAADLKDEQVTPRMQSDTTGRAVATDVGTSKGANYTYHTEPPEVGGACFVHWKSVVTNGSRPTATASFIAKAARLRRTTPHALVVGGDD